MISFAILVVLLAQSAWSYSDDLYQFPDSSDPYFSAEEYPEDEDLPIYRRASNNFLRFGRGDDSLKMHDSEESTRPTRSGNLDRNNDYFIRFGRSKQDFLRFGRNANHLRFGRSLPQDQPKTRTKRDTYPDFKDFKRAGNNFLRFGRNSNFLRFGRNQGTAATPEVLAKINQLNDSPLVQLLSELLENIKKGQQKCDATLMAA